MTPEAPKDRDETKDIQPVQSDPEKRREAVQTARDNADTEAKRADEEAEKTALKAELEGVLNEDANREWLNAIFDGVIQESFTNKGYTGLEIKKGDDTIQDIIKEAMRSYVVEMLVLASKPLEDETEEAVRKISLIVMGVLEITKETFTALLKDESGKTKAKTFLSTALKRKFNGILESLLDKDVSKTDIFNNTETILQKLREKQTESVTSSERKDKNTEEQQQQSPPPPLHVPAGSSEQNEDNNKPFDEQNVLDVLKKLDGGVNSLVQTELDKRFTNYSSKQPIIVDGILQYIAFRLVADNNKKTTGKIEKMGDITEATISDILTQVEKIKGEILEKMSSSLPKPTEGENKKTDLEEMLKSNKDIGVILSSSQLFCEFLKKEKGFFGGMKDMLAKFFDVILSIAPSFPIFSSFLVGIIGSLKDFVGDLAEKWGNKKYLGYKIRAVFLNDESAQKKIKEIDNLYDQKSLFASIIRQYKAEQQDEIGEVSPTVKNIQSLAESIPDSWSINFFTLLRSSLLLECQATGGLEEEAEDKKEDKTKKPKKGEIDYEKVIAVLFGTECMLYFEYMKGKGDFTTSNFEKHALKALEYRKWKETHTGTPDQFILSVQAEEVEITESMTAFNTCRSTSPLNSVTVVPSREWFGIQKIVQKESGKTWSEAWTAFFALPRVSTYLQAASAQGYPYSDASKIGKILEESFDFHKRTDDTDASTVYLENREKEKTPEVRKNEAVQNAWNDIKGTDAELQGVTLDPSVIDKISLPNGTDGQPDLSKSKEKLEEMLNSCLKGIEGVKNWCVGLEIKILSYPQIEFLQGCAGSSALSGINTIDWTQVKRLFVDTRKDSSTRYSPDSCFIELKNLTYGEIADMLATPPVNKWPKKTSTS